MVERPELLAKIRERLGNKLLPNKPGDHMSFLLEELSVGLFAEIKKFACDPEISKASLSTILEKSRSVKGAYHTPSSLCAVYLDSIFSTTVVKPAIKNVEEIGAISKAATACMLDVAKGAQFVVEGLLCAHEPPPPNVPPHKPGHVVARLLEEDKSGVKVIDWCIETLRKGTNESIKTSFGESIQVPDPIKHYENRAIVIEGAELFKSLYLKLYPTAEQICSEAKPPFA